MRNSIIRKLTFFLLPLVGLTASVSAHAESKNIKFDSVEEKNLVSGKFVFDATKGYIFLHGNTRQWGVFIKEPSRENIAAYEAEWAEEFEKAKDKYSKQLKSWEALRQAKSGGAGDKPVEPTAETFSIGPIEMRNSVSFGPQFVFSKDTSDKENPEFSYLVEVEPGNYNYLGPVMSIPAAAGAGVCYCMGSVKFAVKAGEITDLGNFLTNAPAMDNGGTALLGPMLLEAKSPDSKLLRWLKLPVRFGLPASLSAFASSRAEFAPSGKQNNIYRAMVSRMGPIEGLFAYDRDQVIDLRDEKEKTPVAANDADQALSSAKEAVADTDVLESDGVTAGTEIE